jgi:phosphonopyruvate decarboxylase
MLRSDFIVETLARRNIDFFTGVPDSLLGSLCSYLTDCIDGRHHVIAANEGNAVALAAGNYLATGQVACVYMQNSGLGNAVNPLVSLADPSVYGIPMLIIIGWRGAPGTADEPQHIRQGALTIPQLEILDIPYAELPQAESDAGRIINDMAELAHNESRPVALIVRKGTFVPYKSTIVPSSTTELSREGALELIVSELSETDIVVSTTGKASRELYEIRERSNMGHESDFLVVGSMGHASEIAAGIALSGLDRRVICIDGDGALLMHMGALAVGANLDIPNFRHIVLNNGVHDSVGGMPTAGQQIKIDEIASACGYKYAATVDGSAELQQILPEFMQSSGPSLLNVIVKPGARSDLGRPKISPADCKINFMEKLGERGGERSLKGEV